MLATTRRWAQPASPARPCRASAGPASDVPKLLIRDLRQVVSPAGTDAPLRGISLGALELVERGYVLCDGATIEAVGRMRDLGPLADDVVELDGSGLCAIPGLVDCHTHPAFGGDRVEEFSLRAAGAGYEQLHAAGGGILATVRATREAGESGIREAVARHCGWMLQSGTTTFEGKSGYGLDLETELASLRAIRDLGGAPTFLGAHATPPEFDDPHAYLEFVLADVLPEAAKLAEAADVFLERGAFDVELARRYLEAARPEGIAALAASDVTGVLLPASALFLARPMPPARALVDAGAAVALASDFNPGSAFCESLPLVISLAATQLGMSPNESLAACTVNAAHVLGRAARLGRIAPGYAADLVLLDAPDWRYLAYHLGGRVVGRTIKGGAVGVGRPAY